MRVYQKSKRSLKSLQGLSAKRNGADAETQVELISQQYARDGVAEVSKRYEPYKRLSGGSPSGVFKAAYTGQSGCDFELWLRDGRAGHLEMKSREAERISKEALNNDQQAQLQRRLDWGQLALVLVRLKGEWVLVPYARWHEGTRKTHNMEQLLKIGVAVPLRGTLPDFLKALELLDAA